MGSAAGLGALLTRPPAENARCGVRLSAGSAPDTTVRNQAMVRRSPSSNGTRGSQPISVRMRVMSGQRRAGSSASAGRCSIGTVAAGHGFDDLRELQDGALVGVAHVVDPPAGHFARRIHHRPQPGHHILDIAEGAGLLPIAIDGDRAAR